jgi:hypothetical protein
MPTEMARKVAGDRRTAIRLLCLLGLVLPLAVGSSEALLPDYHFEFLGRVQDERGVPLANYTVSVFRYVPQAPSRWELLRTCYNYDSFLTLSHTNGFFMSVDLCDEAPDSLAVGVILPNTVVIGSIVDRRALSYSEKIDTFSGKKDRSFWCDQATSSEFVTDYYYESADSLSVVVPDSLIARLRPQ